ncbi:glycosyltransferase family 4 protein [Adhaeribacter rhizoryzae]|uniref:Glycosyltransferase family 4 protein n=1 Tax=Adhaeribacter rhizoryzae TaxID=2607907 RepID=A0A5M6DR42_9BACT|nr:glycosyltransferase family 1 protein [Adhaeribacter rhizoryzae]KAA5548670.1 glycosyltransferase family 4 protein [Adhaeribacter rhizoryzae]
MKIGLDAKRAFNNTSGLGNYSRFVISGLAERFPADEYFLFTPRVAETFRQFHSATNQVKVITPTNWHKALPALWRTFGLGADLRKQNIGLYHGLSNELPAGLPASLKQVVTIHDLIFIRYPELYKPIDRQVYHYKFRYACHRADKIIAISEQTQQDIIQHYKIPEDKIEVIYQDCNPIFHQLLPAENLQEIRQKYNLPATFILCVGTLEPRKNQLQLLRAWHRAGLAADLPVVFIGRATAYKQELEAFIQENNLRNKLIFLPYIPTEELPAIYQLAYLFVYPSVFEGFGIPILEALNSGVPVITSTGSCFSEAGGEAALYANPNNIDQLADLLTQAAQNQQLRTTMIQKGLEQALRFRPEKTITPIHQLYVDLLAGK